MAILGRIVDAATGSPVSEARVTLSSGARANLTTSTDASGGFSFTTAAATAHQLTVNATGYLSGEYGQIWPQGPGRSLRFNDERRDEVVIRLWKPAAVSGTIRTSRGHPLASATIELVSVGYPPQGRQPAVNAVRTDDAGNYQFVDVMPSRYVLAVVQSYRSDCWSNSPVPSEPVGKLDEACKPYPVGHTLAPQTVGRDRTNVYVTTFYPGVVDVKDAQPIVVHAGDRLQNIDVVMDPQPTVRLVGALSGFTEVNGQFPSTAVSLTRLGNVRVDVSKELRHAMALTDGTGRFAFPGVPPGDYELRAVLYPKSGKDIPPYRTTDERGLPIIRGVVAGDKPVSENAPILEATQVVSVRDADVRDVSLVLQRASILRGTTSVARTQTGPSSEQLSRSVVTLRPVSDKIAVIRITARLDPSGSFELPSLISGKYLLALSGLPGWRLQSVDGNGKANADGIVEIACCGVNQVAVTLTSRPSSLDGTVVSADRSEDELFVLLFPADSTAWSSADARFDLSYRMTRTATGTFYFQSLGRGDYLVIAVQQAAMDLHWREPENLKRLSLLSTRVAIAEGQSAKLSVRPVRID